MKLELTSSEKSAVFLEIEKYLKDLSLEITSKDANRPWGGFFVIDEKQAHHFGKLFFPDENLSEMAHKTRHKVSSLVPSGKNNFMDLID